VLLKAGATTKRKKCSRADLAKNTGNPRSLYGLYRALEGQKKYAATETKASFDKAWASADVTLGDRPVPAPDAEKEPATFLRFT
jgi:hypothetical protein